MDRRWFAGLLGLWLPAVLWASASADEPPDRERVEAEAVGQATEADRLFKAGEFAAALPLYEAERKSRRALGDLRYEAYAARAAGCCHERLGDLDAAVAAWNAARALDSKREDRGFEGYDWTLIGKARLHQNRLKDAEDSLNRALPLLAKTVDRDHEAEARLLLVRTLTELDRAAEASQHLERAWSLAQALGDPKWPPMVLGEMARVALALDQPGPAAEWLSEARQCYREAGLTADVARADRCLGEVMIELERPDVAFAQLTRAAEAHEKLHDASSLASDLHLLASISAGEKKLGQAQSFAERAIAACRAADDPLGEVEERVALAHFQSLVGDWLAASASLGPALVLARRHSEPAEQVRLLVLAGEVEHRARREPEVTSLLSEAQAIAQRTGNAALREMVGVAKRRLSADRR